MVIGIDKFREHFAAHEGQYAIIGGTACDMLFDAAGLDFRATRDIDMVLCVEVVDAEFGRAFHAFLVTGGYQARERSALPSLASIPVPRFGYCVYPARALPSPQATAACPTP